MTLGLYTRLVDDDRFHTAIAAIEATLATDPLIYAVSRSATLVRLDDPGAWVKANLVAGRSRHIYNGNKHALVALLATDFSPHLVLEDEPLIFIHVEFPDTPRLPDLVRAACPAARAFWGHASPSDTAVAIVEGAGRRNLPPRDEIGLSRPPAPMAMPDCFGWLNYWSIESCRLLDVSLDDPRLSVFARVTPIEGHGLMLQLTDEPLELDRPGHLAALTAAYDTFPAISQARSP